MQVCVVSDPILPTYDPAWLIGEGRGDACDALLCCLALLEADDSATEPCIPLPLTFASSAPLTSFVTLGILLALMPGPSSPWVVPWVKLPGVSEVFDVSESSGMADVEAGCIA